MPSVWQLVLVGVVGCGLYLVAVDVRERYNRRSLTISQQELAERERILGSLVERGAAAVPELVGLLSSPDPNLRRFGLLGLERLDRAGRGAVEPVRQRLGDNDALVREHALITLARICEDRSEVSRQAAALLEDPDEGVRATATKRLEASGKTAIVPVIEMAGSNQATARVLVVQILKDIDSSLDPAPVTEVLRRLLDDSDPDVELAAIEAVVGRGAAGIDDIRAWLRNENPVVVDQALRAVMALGPEAGEALPELADLLGQDSNRQPLLAEALGSLRDAARPALGQLFQRAEESNGVERLKTAKAMVEIGVEPAGLVRVLEPLFSCPDSVVSVEAGRLLNQTNPAEARQRASQLTEALAADGMAPRLAVLQQLTVVGPHGPEAVSCLVRLLSHADSEVRLLAIQGLGCAGPDAEAAVPALLMFLNSPRESYRVKARVIETLGAIGPAARPAVPSLLRFARIPSPHRIQSNRYGVNSAAIEILAIRALGRIGDDSHEVVSELSRMLSNDSSQYATANIGLYWATTLSALVSLDRSSHATASIVSRLLEHPSAVVRAQAALAARRLPRQGRATISQLEEMLHDADPVVKSAAASSLASLGADARAAIPALRNLARDPRNIVPNRFRLRHVLPGLESVPGHAELLRQSVAGASRSALIAIETAGAHSSIRPVHFSIRQSGL
jgi:HEAT repeat protein